MANKDLNIGIKVDSSQLDQTVQKVGQLKQLSKTVSIQYDINGKPIDVVIDKTLNLQKQFRALVAERRKVAEGTAEFQLLSTKIGDVEDALARSNAKSRDLLGSLQLIPGPVGQFASQLNGAVSALKLFSSFSLKDLQFQFKELVNDFKDIFTNVGQVNNAMNGSVNATEQATDAFREQGDTIASVIDESKGIVDQYDKQSAAVKAISNATDLAKVSNDKFALGLVRNADTGELVTGVINKQTNATRVLTKAELEAVASGKAFTLTTEGMVVAEGAATVATFSLAGAVKALGLALGIGGLILILTFVVDKLIDGAKALWNFVDGTSAAEEATKGLTAALDEQDASYDKANKSLKRVTNERIALMKAQGASEEQIRKANIKGMIDERDITIKTLSQTQDVIRKLQANRTGRFGQNLDNEETNKALERALKKKKELEETYKDQTSAIKVAELNNITEINKKITSDNQKRADDNKKIREQEINDEKTAAQMLLDIKKENALASIKDERQRQYRELELQAATEVDKINALKISEEKKGELRNQVFLKYSKKQIDLNQKFNDEDIKKAEELAQKKQDILDKINQYSINAIADQRIRERAEAQKKFDDELKVLDKALKDKLVTQKQYDDAVKNMKIALENELKKIDDDAKQREKDELLKKLDEDIKIQQILNEANVRNFKAYWDGREQLLMKAKQRELAEVEAGSAQALAIEKKYATLSKQLQQEKYLAIIGFVSQGLSAASNIISQAQQVNQLAQQNELDAAKGNAQEQDKIKEKYFNKNKNGQIAQAIIQTLQSATGAFASLAPIPVVGPALGAAAAAAALVFGYKQVDQIKKQQYQSSLSGDGGAAAAAPNYGRNYEKGGMIGGRRHAQGGTIIEAEQGEAIMTRGAVTMFRPLLSLMNQAGGGVSFNSNLTTTGFDNPKVSTPAEDNKPMIVKTYVVSSELTNEQQRQARLKDLSTL